MHPKFQQFLDVMNFKTALTCPTTTRPKTIWVVNTCETQTREHRTELANHHITRTHRNTIQVYHHLHSPSFTIIGRRAVYFRIHMACRHRLHHNCNHWLHARAPTLLARNDVQFMHGITCRHKLHRIFSLKSLDLFLSVLLFSRTGPQLSEDVVCKNPWGAPPPSPHTP